MMKLNFLLFSWIVLAFPLAAQQIPVDVKGARSTAPMAEQPSPGFTLEPEEGTIDLPLLFRGLETQIGLTRFELQSIGSLGRRVAAFDDGRVSAAWLHGLDEAGNWPDRGTAYNHYDGTEWGDDPTSSLEVVRSGYPSFTNTPSGTEVVLSHKSESGNLWILQSHYKLPEEANWNETEISSVVPGGPVWPKIATGGPDGNTVHCLAVSVDPMFGGAVYLGMDQHPIYFRSQDNGVSWDQTDVILPGLDSNFYNNVYGEGYNIDANGSVVAAAIFDSWGDVAIVKSTDNGTSWEKTIVKDFPLDKYDGNGYTTDDIPDDPNAPDSLYMLSCDYSGSVLVDNNGKVHVFFGLMYVFAQGADQFLDLATGAMAYWNEDFGPDSIQVIAELEDFDGDGMITINGDLADIRYTNAGLVSYPSAGIDSEGNIYLVYMALREDIAFDDNHYRHVFIIKSEDGGASWSAPYDLINAETTDFPEFIEASYPSIPARIGESIELVYQQDLQPGLTTVGETEDQLIMHLSLDKNTFGMISGTHEAKASQVQWALTPNPATEQIQIEYTLEEAANVQISLYNPLGSRVAQWMNQKAAAGPHSPQYALQGLQKGLYLVALTIDGKTFSKKLIVE
jgi:hypothetical protein